jgi:CHAT domain/TPR repeat
MVKNSAAELYNAGNAASRAGQHTLAIAHYTAAIRVDPDFPEAFYNRAIEHSKAGDEESCFFDLINAMDLGYDTDNFWDTFFGHVRPPLLASLLEDASLPAALIARIRSRAEDYVQKGTVFLRAFPELDIQFCPASLPDRFMLSSFVRDPNDMSAEVFRSVFDFCLESGRIGDDEFAWRAKFLVATVLYDEYQTTEWSSAPSGGIFFDDFYETNRPHWGVGESVLQAAVSTRMPARPGESVQQHLARFTLALTQDAAETLLRLRAASPPPPRSASRHWDLADPLFKIMVGTAMYLDDPNEVLRCIALARKTNAAFAVAQWVQGRHQPDELLAVVAPPSDAAEQRRLQAFPPPGTILTEYFIYETGGDNLVRACLAPARARLSQRYLSPSAVEALVGLGRQWQDPESFSELRKDPNVDLRSLILLAAAADAEVPTESYDEWLGDALLDQEVFDLAPDCHRLVFLPYNYLHNLPFHLLPQVLRRTDAGQIDEVVVSPSLMLSQRLAKRTPVQRDTASCLFVGINSAEVDADAEYAAVRQSFHRADALLDADATAERVLATAVGYDVVHIACHGGFDIEDNTGYLLLANGERLYPADLALARGLCADLVLLNACISGVNPREARNGDQALGLPSALLHAGARQVIGTLWQVEADVALEFASTFYRDWQLVPDSTASIVLRVQRRLRELSTDIFTWGAHAVFGDWR